MSLNLKHAMILGGIIGLPLFLLHSRWEEANLRQENLRAQLHAHDDSPQRSPAGIPNQAMVDLGSVMSKMLAASGAVRTGTNPSMPDSAVASPPVSSAPVLPGVPNSSPADDPATMWRKLSDQLEQIPVNDLNFRSQVLWNITELAQTDREQVFRLAIRELELVPTPELQATETEYNHTVVALRVALDQSESLNEAIDAFRLAIDHAQGAEQRGRMLKYFEMYSNHPGSLNAARQVAAQPRSSQ